MMDPEAAQFGIELAESVARYAAKSASGAIWNRIQLAKQKKDLEEARQAYEDIINELIQDNTDLVSTAQAYKAKLDQVEISDEDIKSLQGTVSQVLDIIKDFTPMDSDTIEAFNKLRQLLTADTLRTLQLLGFNYHDAIGGPLTEICKNAILGLGGIKQPPQNSKGSTRRRR